MFDTDLNAAYSLRRLFRQYTGPHIRARRSGDNAEVDVMFNSGGLVVTPSNWATWSLGRTILGPIIYYQSRNGKHAIITGECTLNQATKSIVFPLGQHYYTMPQFTLPTSTSPYTVNFHHGVLNSLGSHLYSAGTNTTNRSLLARRNLGTCYASYWWDIDVSINTPNSGTGNYMTFTWIGGARAIYRDGA